MSAVERSKRPWGGTGDLGRAGKRRLDREDTCGKTPGRNSARTESASAAGKDAGVSRRLLQGDEDLDDAGALVQRAERLADDGAEHAVAVGTLHGVAGGRG